MAHSVGRQGALVFSSDRHIIYICIKLSRMATIRQQPAAFSLSGQLNDIVVYTNAQRCRVEVMCDSDTLLDETLYPDGDGQITIAELSQLIAPYARRDLVVTFMAKVSELDSDGTPTATVSTDVATVLCCAADTGTTAQEFCSSHFLTTLNGTKITAMGREERLYAYDATAVSITADVVKEPGVIEARQATLTAASTTKGVSAFFVSPDNVAALLGLVSERLLGYTVTAGQRVQMFSVVEDSVRPAPVFAFINSFGCLEFLHCNGKHLKESKYSRQTARFRGVRRNYLIEEDRQFTANTGVLNQWMADWADEVMRSYEVYLWVDGRRGRQVVVTDSKSDIDNLPDSMPAFELTYGYAQRNHNVMQPTHAGRIFDNTFDHTFE